VKLRSRLRVTPDDLQAWIANRRQLASQPSRRAAARRSARGAPRGTFRSLVDTKEPT
jgi:hypothetical protein